MSKTRKKRCGHYNSLVASIGTRKKRGGHYNLPVARQRAVKTSNNTIQFAEASVKLPKTAITKEKLESKGILITNLKDLKNKSIVYILRDGAKYALSYEYMENEGFLRINESNTLSEWDEYYHNPAAYELKDIEDYLSDDIIKIYKLNRYNKNTIFSP
jgi:hypothetical protein